MATTTIRIRNALSTPQRYTCALDNGESSVLSSTFVITTPTVEPNSVHDVTLHGGLYLWATPAEGTDIQVLGPVTPNTRAELTNVDGNPVLRLSESINSPKFALAVDDSLVGGTFGLGVKLDDTDDSFHRLAKSDVAESKTYIFSAHPLLKVSTSQPRDADEPSDTIPMPTAASFTFPDEGETITVTHQPVQSEALIVTKGPLEDVEDVRSAVVDIGAEAGTNVIANIRGLLFEGPGAQLPQQLAKMAIALGGTKQQRRGLEQRLKEYEASVLGAMKADANEGLRPSSANPLTRKVQEQMLPSGHSIAATAWSPMHIRVYFQDAEGGIREYRYDNSVWSGGDVHSSIILGLKMKCKPKTPLAVVNWSEGQQIRLYYVNREDVLQEHCYTAGVGWYRGDLNTLQVRVDHNSKISAIHWRVDCNIRVYVQEPLKKAIQEYWYGIDTVWRRGETLWDARPGSGIAATRWITGPLDGTHRNVHIRVYYQDEQFMIREMCWHVGGWFHGKYTQKALATTSLAAFAWHGDGIHIRIFFQDPLGHLVEHRFGGDEWNPPERVGGAFDDASPFGAVQVQNGRHLRIYLREREAGGLLEKCHGAMSTYWWQGEFGGS